MKLNKKAQMKGPGLTWIFIGIAFAIATITISMTSYSTFLSDNGVDVSDNFNGIYGNISSEQANLNTIHDTATESSGIFSVLKDIGGGAVNVFVTGLSSIGAFFEMGTVASSILNTTEEAIPGLDAIFGLLVLVSTLYLVMSLIQARRGVSVLP